MEDRPAPVTRVTNRPGYQSSHALKLCAPLQAGWRTTRERGSSRRRSSWWRGGCLWSREVMADASTPRAQALDEEAASAAAAAAAAERVSASVDTAEPAANGVAGANGKAGEPTPAPEPVVVDARTAYIAQLRAEAAGAASLEAAARGRRQLASASGCG